MDRKALPVALCQSESKTAMFLVGKAVISIFLVAFSLEHILQCEWSRGISSGKLVCLLFFGDRKKENAKEKIKYRRESSIV